MPQSLSRVIVHIVFSTKNRDHLLNNDILPSLHSYLATIIRDMNAEAYRIGGTTNHIHIACSLPRTITQSDFVRDIKSLSSKWLKWQLGTPFSWQRGYGIFSIGQSQLNRLIHYIENQLKHHKKISYKQEIMSLIKKYNVEYDEEHIWD